MPQTRHPRPTQVFPHILQNTFRAIGHRTVHRPLCHEYLAPDRTTFSGLSSFYTVLWHITLKAICKITEFLTCLKHATSRPSLSIPFQNHLVRLIPTLTGQNSYRCRFCPAIQVFHRTNLCPIAKPNRRSQNCKKRLEYRNAMGASYLILLK